MLVVFTLEQAITLFGGKEAKAILTFITKQGYGRREFLINDEWMSEPQGKVKDMRFCLEGFFQEVKDIAQIWRFIKNNCIQTPEQPDKILKQLSTSRLRPEKLKFFSPWGPRYSKGTSVIAPFDPEIGTLLEIKTVFRVFREKGYTLDFLLMPADTYGIDINARSKEFVLNYFRNLEYAAREILGDVCFMQIKPWSQIREENLETYREMVEPANAMFRRFQSDPRFVPLIEGILTIYDSVKNEKKDEYLLESARKRFRKYVLDQTGDDDAPLIVLNYPDAIIAARIFNPEDSYESAKKYCVERFAEAVILNKQYELIKLSLVRKEKDSLDGALKRVYLIRNRAPWLGGK